MGSVAATAAAAVVVVCIPLFLLNSTTCELIRTEYVNIFARLNKLRKVVNKARTVKYYSQRQFLCTCAT